MRPPRSTTGREGTVRDVASERVSLWPGIVVLVAGEDWNKDKRGTEDFSPVPLMPP